MKPRTQILTINGGAFNGKTEYQKQFIPQKGEADEEPKTMPLS